MKNEFDCFILPPSRGAFILEIELADRHVARDERYGVGEIGKGFLCVGLDVNDDRVPRRCAFIGRILYETQNE